MLLHQTCVYSREVWFAVSGPWTVGTTRSGLRNRILQPSLASDAELPIHQNQGAFLGYLLAGLAGCDQS